MRLHVVSLPHTTTTTAFSWCAYTEKCRKFASMMYDRGHEVYLYSGESNEARCTEHIPVVKDPEHSNPNVPDWTLEFFQPMNTRVIEEMQKRANIHDFICLIGGWCQGPIKEAFPVLQTVEFGIGYDGTLPDVHHVYESYAWMHSVLGSKSTGGAMALDGKFYDAVIPNYFEEDQFPMGTGEGDYLLFVGRLIRRKGVQIALDLAKFTDRKLVVAGQVGDFGDLPNWVDYRGVVGPKERAELMGNARCIITPTLYIEPFGGVAVEAQMCGTPAITTDWGAFPETIDQELSGFRCHNMKEFIEAVDRVENLHRPTIRRRAHRLYSTTSVALKYEQYFQRLLTLWGDGFYQT